MPRKTKQQLTEERLNAVVNLVKVDKDSTAEIRRKWRDNYEMFCHGTEFRDKADWQSQFSINKLASSIRAAAANLKRTLVHNPDWFDLDPYNPDSERAAELAPAIKKYVRYLLDTANFIRHADTFILQSLLSMGACFVGWKPRLIPNPAFIAAQTRKKRQELQKELAPFVVNPGADSTLSEEEALNFINKALDTLQKQATGEASDRVDADEKPYFQVGGLDIQIPIAEDCGWDTNVSYMEDSNYAWYRTTMRMSDVKAYAKMGFFDKKVVKDLEASNPSRNPESFAKDRTYKGRTTDGGRYHSEVDLLIYFGPLALDGEAKPEMWSCIIANDSHMLRESPYPFWEPKNHKHALIMAAARQIPHMPTGQGIGDTAVSLQRALDSNYTLLNDTMRFGVVGINVVNTMGLVEETLFEEGIEPGSIIQTRDDPKKVFHHVDLTSNIENQVKPIQLALEQGIDDLTGVSALSFGGNNLRSRTTAAEISARQSGSDGQIDSIALDLETRFLVPFLEKTLARALQFGLPELRNNPEVKGVLTDEEINLLSNIGAEERASLLFNFFQFKIKGFSFQQDHQERLARINEAFQIANSGGPLQEVFPFVPALKRWLKEMDMEELGAEVNPDSKQAQLQQENNLLLSNRPVMVLPDDDHEAHLRSHQVVSMSSQPTPAMQEHVQMHQQAMQQLQAQQQAQEQGSPQGQSPAQLPN